MSDKVSHVFSGANVLIIIQILLVISGQFVFGQNTGSTYCGTPDLSNYIGDAANMDYHSFTRRSTLDYYAIQVFSVAKSNGEGRLSDLEMREALCALNVDFFDYGLQFYLKNPIREINNDDYYEHNSSNGYKMMRNNNVSGAFNVYIVKDPNSTCGYFSPANDAVAVSQSCFIGGTHALTHEMGHYLGLPHTFKGWENHTYNEDNVPDYLGVRGRDTQYVETVDGSNCTISGDKFCDTPPDYISDRWNCNGEGLSIKNYFDPKGVEFKVDGTNFMSYADDRCQSMFTPEQTDRMHTILETRYSNRRYKFIPPVQVTGEDVGLISPGDESEVDYNNVRLQWEPLTDAEEYIIQVSVLPGILFEKDNKMLEFKTNNTEITIPANQLKPGKKYYWRVIPLNSFTLCPEPGNQQAFTPHVGSNTHLLPGGNQISISPNIIPSGKSRIRILYHFINPRNIQLHLYNLNGQLISFASHKIIGDTETSFYVHNLNAGLYILHISDGKEVVSQKIMVQ